MKFENKFYGGENYETSGKQKQARGSAEQGQSSGEVDELVYD